MKQNVTLTVLSLLTLLFVIFHLADDIRIGLAPPGLSNLIGIAVAAVWLYGTLALAGRRSGYIIVLLGSIVGVGVPVIHMRGPHGMLGPHLTQAGGIFFFVWTLLAMGTMAAVCVILSVHGLWSLRSGQAR
jgi:hypothetical protein